MTARLPFMLGAALAISLLAVLMIGRALPARPPIVAARTGMPFLERWQEPQPAPLVPKEVRVIPITPRVKPQPVVAQAPMSIFSTTKAVAKIDIGSGLTAPPLAKAKPKREREAKDICTRHGLRKVTTNNGRSWRCKRS